MTSVKFRSDFRELKFCALYVKTLFANLHNEIFSLENTNRTLAFTNQTKGGDFVSNSVRDKVDLFSSYCFISTLMQKA